MSFNKLPNELLLNIFKRLCLQKRIQLRLVSARCSGLIQGLCLKVTTLKVFGSKRDFDYRNRPVKPAVHEEDNDYTLWTSNKDEDLVVNADHFDDKTCDLLVRIFPNVDNLIVEFSTFELWKYVPYLLKKFSGVVSLALYGWYDDADFYVQSDDEEEKAEDTEKDDTKKGENCEDKVETMEIDENVEEGDDKKNASIPNQIVCAINSLSSLKHLILYVSNLFNWPAKVDREFDDMDNVMSQLESLSLSGMNQFSTNYPISDDVPLQGTMLDSLGPKCISLSFDNIPYADSEFFGSFTCNPHLSKNLKYLQLESINQDHVDTVFELFSDLEALESLWLSFSDRHIFQDSNLRELLPLKNLTELRFESQTKVDNVLDFFEKPDNNEALVSVKRFYWLDFSFDDNDYDQEFDGEEFCGTLSAWFPNLEELYIYPIDQYDGPNYVKVIIKQFENNVHAFPHLTKYRFKYF